jgi:cytochrome c peroxidase
MSCRKDSPDEAGALPNLRLPLGNYSYGYPAMGAAYETSGLPFFEATPEDNPTTDAGAALGRVLFYDVRLSANNTVSCASCHKQSHGFADNDAFSAGLHGVRTDRNASHLINLRYNRRQFWDMRAQTLEQQVLLPIQHPIEMGLNLDQMIEKISSTTYYPALFESAFATPEMTTDRVSKALSQFIRSIVSIESKYDQGVISEYSNFTAQELEGMNLFFNGVTRCNQCHMTGNFFTPQAMNNGLAQMHPMDSGFFAVTGNVADVGKFKVPSLRNVAMTSPYMHDGRFASLMDVINHYDHGVVAQPTLDERVTEELTIGGTPYQLQLSHTEKEALVAFLHTLTDSTLLLDPRYSDPFEH